MSANTNERDQVMMMPRPIDNLLMALTMAIFLSSAPLVVQAAETQPVELEALIDEALAHNPEIRGGEAQWQVLVEKSKQSGAWDDPMLMLKIQNAMISDPLAFDQDPTTAKVIGISQMVPFFGKRSLLRAGAEQEAAAAHWSLEERKVELRKMVTETWAQLAYVESSLGLVEQNILLLDDINRLAETSYGTGMGKQQEVLRGQIERSRMEEMKISWEQQRRSLQAMFAALLHRDQGEEIAVPPGAIVPVTLSAAELEELALKSRPELFARSAKVAKAQAAEDLAQREYYPDFTFSFEYMQRDAFSNAMAASNGADMYSAGVTFNLPVQLNKRRAMVAESQAEKSMAEAEVDGLRHEIRRGIADDLAKLDASANMARLYREGIIPQSEFSREATLASFRSGQAEFMAVLDSEMKLFGVQQQYNATVAEHQMLRAQLEATVGTRLP